MLDSVSGISVSVYWGVPLGKRSPSPFEKKPTNTAAPETLKLQGRNPRKSLEALGLKPQNLLQTHDAD